MGIAEEYEKRVKTPIIKVTATKFSSDDTPGVENEGTDYFPEVVSCDITYGFDQASTTCTLELSTPLDVNGDYVRFTPMDRVKVEQGWNKPSTYRISFFGFIDKVEYSNPPKTVRFECRDTLKLAQDNYYIHSNRKVYSAVPTESELDSDGNEMGGQAVADRQAQSIITDFMTESGVPSGYLHLDFETYPTSGSIVIGNNAVAVFVYESAMDAVSRITDLIGYRIWADKAGHVQCKEIRPIAGTTPSQTYQSQIETYTGDEVWTVDTAGNLLSISASRDDDLRNWVTVFGYDGINVTFAGESDYVPSPPTYRRTEVRSYLLDTPELLTTVASGIYNDLNRLKYIARAQIEGDPRLEIGQTVKLVDAHSLEEGTDYFLYDFTSSMRAGVWTMDLNLVGGTGTGSVPLANISPIAMFSSRVEQEYLADGTRQFDVTVDATPSYDPNGPIEDLLYTWTTSGFATASGILHTYVTEDTGIMYVTLNVKDQGTPQLESEIELAVSLDVGDSIQMKTLYAASTEFVHVSTDGGLSWGSQEIW